MASNAVNDSISWRHHDQTVPSRVRSVLVKYFENWTNELVFKINFFTCFNYIMTYLYITVTSHKRKGAWNHRRLDCLINSVLWLTRNKTSKVGIPGPLWRESPSDCCISIAVCGSKSLCHNVIDDYVLMLCVIKLLRYFYGEIVHKHLSNVF